MKRNFQANLFVDKQLNKQWKCILRSENSLSKVNFFLSVAKTSNDVHWDIYMFVMVYIHPLL